METTPLYLALIRPIPSEKLLALSETKLKNSSSSTPVPSSATHISNSRFMLSTSSNMAHSNTSWQTNVMNGGGNVSPVTPLSPRAKMRSTSNSQPLKNNHNTSTSAIPLSSESSSVSTIKLNDSYNGEKFRCRWESKKCLNCFDDVASIKYFVSLGGYS